MFHRSGFHQNGFHRNALSPARDETVDTPLAVATTTAHPDAKRLLLHEPSSPPAPCALQPASRAEYDQEITVKLSELHEARLAVALELLACPTTASDEVREETIRSPFIHASDLFYLTRHLKGGIVAHDEISERLAPFTHRVSALEREISDIIEVRNSDPELMRRICQERALAVADARNFLETLSEIRLLFFVEGIGLRVGGIVGRAMLMIEALLHELPNVRVHIHSAEKSFSAAGAAFGSPAEGRLTMGQFPTTEADLPGHTAADMVVSVRGGRPTMVTTPCPAAHITLYPFAYVQELGSLRWLGAPNTPELSPVLHHTPVCNDLHNPRGTVILDRGQYKARQERDGWDLAHLTKARRAWRSAVIPEPCNAALERAAAREGWSIDEAIWSVCYIWNTDVMARELQALASVVRDTPRALPSNDASSPPHIVIHTRVTGWGDFHQMSTQLAAIGIRTISTETPFQPIYRPDVPPLITIVAHSTIDNIYMRQAFAQLVGCPVRDSGDTHWIDFPVYVTGSASWLESVSAGGIALHDDMDTISGTKQGQIASLMLKQRILAGESPSGTLWSALHKQAKSESLQYLIGGDPDGSRYKNLERLSAQARMFTDALYQCNSVDDVIVALADKIRGRNNT